MLEFELVREEEAVMGDSGVGEKYESPKRSAGDVRACGRPLVRKDS